MKTRALFALIGFASFMFSCSEEKVLSPIECHIQTFGRISPRETMTVTYELRSSGESQVSQWFYYGPEGRMVIDRPLLPAIMTVTLSLNDSICAGAIGSVMRGSLRVSYRAVSSDTLIEASDLCIQSLNGTPVLP